MSIMDRNIVLKLNKSWMPVGIANVKDSVIDLCAGINCFALDIDYALDSEGQPDFNSPTKMIPVTWDEWITLPIRPWDNVLRSPSIQVRVPTVIIAKNYDQMPTVRFGKRPSRDQIYERDQGIDQYTGKKLTRDEATLDHVIPSSRGGSNDWTNLVLTHKKINFTKGNKMNDEAGLRLLREPFRPAPRPIYALITDPKHTDWRHFLVTKNK